MASTEAIDQRPKYEILEVLSSGSYAKVYKARSRDVNQLVALKKVTNKMENGFPIDAMREISLLKSFTHENIMHLPEIYYRNRKNIYLVFELMVSDLRDYMHDFEPNGIRLSALRSYMYQITKGLEYIHKRATLHRDLKPENLLIDRQGIIKISDFGMSRAISIPPRTYTTNVVSLWYRAPELLLGKKIYGYPLDVWSLGCIFAEMVTGCILFNGDSDIEQLLKIFGTLGPPKEAYWKNLPNYDFSFATIKLIGLEKKILLRGPAFDLLKSMLIYEPTERISAKRVLKHDYFIGIVPNRLYPPKCPIITDEQTA